MSELQFRIPPRNAPMPIAHVNGVDIVYDLAGDSGLLMMLVHGSWVGGSNWSVVVTALSQSFRVVTYDRRGHSGSAGAPRDGKMVDDVEDLAALIRHLGLGEAHIVGNSYGGIVSLRLASAHPDLVLSVNVHEPPLVDMLKIDPADADLYESLQTDDDSVRAHLESGRNAEGAQAFVDGIFPGVWQTLPEAAKSMFVRNGPTYLDELNDPEAGFMDAAALAGIQSRCLLTNGSESPPFFSRIIMQVAPGILGASRYTFDGVGHVPHQSHPAEFVEKVTAFALDG